MLLALDQLPFAFLFMSLCLYVSPVTKYVLISVLVELRSNEQSHSVGGASWNPARFTAQSNRRKRYLNGCHLISWNSLKNSWPCRWFLLSFDCARGAAATFLYLFTNLSFRHGTSFPNFCSLRLRHQVDVIHA